MFHMSPATVAMPGYSPAKLPVQPGGRKLDPVEKEDASLL
jgi:hypothetical protein